MVRGVIDVRVRNAYAFLIGGLTEIARRYLDRPIPILMHGYDYAIPDGRGVLGGFSFFPGPWLRPGFHRKGHGDLATNQMTVAKLIDRFNDMLRQLSNAQEFAHVRYVNLRNTLLPAIRRTSVTRPIASTQPTERGFRAVATQIAAAI